MSFQIWSQLFRGAVVFMAYGTSDVSLGLQERAIGFLAAFAIAWVATKGAIV